jgi:hypothetical protein
MTTFTSVPIGDRFGWNSMNVHSEYYILYLQPIFFSLFILLNKYKNKLTYSINFAVSLIFILNYVNLFPRPYYNNNLFSPHHSTTANAYECGFHFVRCPKLFFKFKQKVSANLQDSYVKGAIAGLTSTSPDKKDLILKTAKSLGHDYNRLFINK